jgi:hypothetical protein
MLAKNCIEKRFILLASVFIATQACGGSKPAAESASSGEKATDESSSEGTSEGSTAGGSESEGSSSSESGAAAEPAEESKKKPLTALCDTMCGAQSSKCKPTQVADCRRNYCDRYGTPPDACEPSVRAALECGEADPDFLICSHVVPEACAKKFKAAESCLSTGVAPEAVQEGPKMPEGWAKYEARDANFTVSMPKGVAVKTEGGAKTWSVESGGVKYEIRREAAPSEKKFDQKTFTRVAGKVLGDCAGKMKLFSIIERPDRSFIQFRTSCPDKTQQRGVLYVQGSDFFVLRATGADTAKSPDADTFAYSFERP